MSRDLFENVVTPSIKVGPRHWSSVPLSMASHLVVIGVLVAAPLMATRALPTPDDVIPFIELAAVPPPPMPVVVRPQPVAVPESTASPDIPVFPELTLPTASSSTSGDTLAPPPNLLPRVGRPGVGDLAVGTGGGLTPAPRVETEHPLPVGGEVRAPIKRRDVIPLYPPVARAARAQGTVMLEAIIAKDGSVRDVRVTRSVPLLDQAALDAVRGWRYSAPTLNGLPIEVVMTVTVTFTLQ
jgi:periplasmic protein TonB